MESESDSDPPAPATPEQQPQQQDAPGSSSVPSEASSEETVEGPADDRMNLLNQPNLRELRSSRSEPVLPGGRVCWICGEVKPRLTLNRWSDFCRHLFCDECLKEYLELEVEEKSWSLWCPQGWCKEMRTAEECRCFLPEAVGNSWVASIPEEARREDERLTSEINRRGFVRGFFRRRRDPSQINQVQDEGSSSNLNLPREGPGRRECRRCRAVDKPRLSRWSYFCQHSFCDECLNEYLDLNVIFESNTWRVQCPEDDCMAMKTPEDCRRFLQELGIR